MYRDVMVDLETTGTLPDRHAIIQIAAVQFDLEYGTVGESYNRCMFIPPHRSWDEGTRNWWAGQDPEILQAILQRAEDPATIMQDFCNWAYPAGSMHFWSKPTHFDFNFVSSYCHDYELPNPFHFRVANDLNTFLRALSFPNEVPDIEISVPGQAHDALHDCFYQIKMLFAHYNRHIGVGLR